MLNYKFLEKGIDSKISIFKILIIGKILLIPFILFLASKYDPRPFNILILPDLISYEKIASIKDFFNINESVPSIGFSALAKLIKILVSSEIWKYITYGFISLFIMTYSQTLLIDFIFHQFPNSTIKQKYLSIFFSLINFYILIYSVKPSTDVFGCLGIVILFLGLYKYNYSNKYYGVSFWLISLLILSLFRSNIFIALPFLFLNKSIKSINLELRKFNLPKKFFIFFIISFLTLINVYQFIGYINLYETLQSGGGLLSQLKLSEYKFSFLKIIELIKILFFKIIFLISARESIGINNDFLITQNSNIIHYPSLVNLLTIFYLFLNNTLGLISIFLRFKKEFTNSFLFTLIPLFPLISYYTHHRYFLPYCIFTSACIPFILKKIPSKV